VADIEPTFTLDEAAKTLARRECMFHGHDFDVVVNGAGVPQRILCERCGELWKVEDSDAG
jgi:hypothetical protein